MKKKPTEPPVPPTPLEKERDASDSEAAGAASGAPASDPRDAEIERLRAREDDLLRAIAELQNVQRRRRQEAETALRYGAEPILREILPILDDLERALNAVPASDDPLRAGVALVRERLLKALEREGLEAIRPRAEAFDPELHDAIAHLPIPGATPGTVVEVAVPGYRYRDRILRHAKVVVAAEAPAPDPGAGTEDAGRDAERRGGIA